MFRSKANEMSDMQMEEHRVPKLFIHPENTSGIERTSAAAKTTESSE